MGVADAFLRRPSIGASKRPHKKMKADDLETDDVADTATASNVSQTLSIAGGPTQESVRRFNVWTQGVLCDVELQCEGKFVVKANKLELAVWSDWLQDELSQSPDSKVLTFDDTDATTLEALIRALYEKEISLTPHTAQLMLALSDRLKITKVKAVVETYLIAQLDKSTAMDALFMAEKHDCKALKKAAIPLAAINFESLSLDQLALLPFDNLKELLGSDHLIIADEESLFASIKAWSKGCLASKVPQVADEQLLTLIDEIRLENIPAAQLNQILDDAWMQQHPKVLSAVAKALVRRTDVTSPLPRKARAGKVVRFSQWTQRVSEVAGLDSKTRLLCSDVFEIDLGGSGKLSCHVQLYPEFETKAGMQPRVGIFLAIEGDVDLPGCSLTLINQRQPTQSIVREFSESFKSGKGSLTFWGSKRFITQEAFNSGGFKVEDSVVIRAVLERSRRLASTPGSTPRSRPSSQAAKK